MRVVEFTTTALRLAEVWQGSSPGNVIAHDLENGRWYFVLADGAGANTMVPMAEQFGFLQIPLDNFRETTTGGDPGNAAAIGGVLASDTTPILLGDAAESRAIVWAASNSDQISTQVALNVLDFDDTRDAYVILRTSSGGTTNAATIACETAWNGGTVVSDNATGAASATPQNNTATVAAADIPANPVTLTLQLVPAAHTTDTMLLHAAWLKYYRK